MVPSDVKVVRAAMWRNEASRDSVAVSKDNAGSPSCCPVRAQQGAAGTGVSI